MNGQKLFSNHLSTQKKHTFDENHKINLKRKRTKTFTEHMTKEDLLNYDSLTINFNP